LIFEVLASLRTGADIEVHVILQSSQGKLLKNISDSVKRLSHVFLQPLGQPTSQNGLSECPQNRNKGYRGLFSQNP